MRLLSVLFLNLVCMLAYGQNRTGGGVVDLNPNEQGGSIYYFNASKIKKFIDHINKREIACSKKSKEDLNTDFYQLYLKHSLLKISAVTGNKCIETERYFKCLYDEEAKSLLDDIIQEKTMPIYMSEKHKINQKELPAIFENMKSYEFVCMKTKAECEM